MPAASFSGALLAIAALAVLGAAHVDAAEAGEAADAETCSAKHVCMDSKLVALLRKHELEAAIAPLVADDVRTLSTLEQLAACEESRQASFAPGWWWWPACDGVDTIVRKPNGLPKRTGEALKKKLPELVAALRQGKQEEEEARRQKQAEEAARKQEEEALRQKQAEEAARKLAQEEALRQNSKQPLPTLLRAHGLQAALPALEAHGISGLNAFWDLAECEASWSWWAAWLSAASACDGVEALVQKRGLSEGTAALLRRKLPVMTLEKLHGWHKEKVEKFERTLQDLMENASLQKLDLRHNQIGDAGAKRIKSDKRIYS